MPETRETTRQLDQERPTADDERRLDAEERQLEDQEEDRGERIDFQTLALAALASAAAALLTSRLWSQGAIISAAMTPVIVALVKEGLRKPTERVTAVGSRVASASKGSLALATPRRATRATPAAPGNGDSRAPAAGAPTREDAAPGAGAPGRRPRRDYALRGRWRILRSKRFHLRMALITGLLAFLIAVFALTVPELIVGDSVGSGGGTTLFGGGDGDAAGSSQDPASGGTSTPSDGEAPSFV